MDAEQHKETKEAPASGGAPAPQARGEAPVAGGWGVAWQGGGSGITHPANRQEESPTPLEKGGEDTLHLALNVWWKDDYEGLMRALEEGKLEAQERRRPVERTFRGCKLCINRQGKKTGGGRGRFYRYLIHAYGLTLLLTDEPRGVEQSPNVLVEVPSINLMLCGGAGNAFSDLRRLLEQLGGYILLDKISRVDLCVDLPGVDTTHFRHLHEAGRLVTRSSFCAFYTEHRKLQGITYGKGTISLRIYDKLLELSGRKHDAFKYALLCQRRWAGSPSAATRVEFQLRREMLTSAGISSMGDYFRKRAELARYLTHEWFRFTVEPPDRDNNNTARTATHPLWEQVQEGFAAWTGEAPESIRRIHKPPHPDPIRLAQQARGALLSAVAELDNSQPMTEHQLRKKAIEIVEWAFDRENPLRTVERYEAKRLRQKKDKR